MEKFRNMVIRFMIGRYGPDDLYKALLGLYFVLIIVNIFAHSPIISLIMWAEFIWAMFRCFSKNIYARQKENIFYLQHTEKLRKFCSRQRTMLTDKEHYYKTCKNCRNTLRLPRKTGTHTAVCPVCKEKITIKIR